MTQMLWTKAGAIAISALSVTACATPTYPIKTGYAPPPPIKPQYSASAEASPTPAPAPVPTPTAAPPASAPPSAALAPATPVQSTPLPSATAAPAPVPAASPAQSALPPNYAPPTPSQTPPPRAQTAPPAVQTSPPQAYRAPETRYRTEPARYITDGKVVAATGMFRDYEVQPHDHLDAIARDLQTTRKVLVDANHLKAPYDLQPGEHLKVPVAKAYVIQSGDTMAAVARRFSVSPGELADLNDLPARGRLQPGEKLALPANFDDRGPTKLPPVVVAETESQPAYAARPSPRSYATPDDSGPYVPSPAALAAAQRLAVARSYGPPTYVPGRPSPNSGIPAPPPRTYAYTPPSATSAAPALSSAVVTAAGHGRFIWPIRGEILLPFGATGLGRRNDGVDVKSPQGAVVRAAAAGSVVYAGDQVPGYGNLVLVKHTDGWATAYAHLNRISVQMRQSVSQGQELGEVGQTGDVTEPQLHFEIRYAPTPADKAQPVDPLLLLPK